MKVYTAARLKKLFDGFDDIEIVKRQMMSHELPGLAHVDAAADSPDG